MAVTFEDVRKTQRKEKASARLCEVPPAYLVELSLAIKESTKGRVVPSWLDVQPEPLEGKVTALPKADELAEGFEPQLIVEICAR